MSAAGSARKRVARALSLAQLGHAQLLFGNLYEAAVKVPELLATQARTREQAMSPFGHGSPVRYYATAAPATLPPVLAATIIGWRHRRSRPWLATAAVCSTTGVAMTVYLVRTVNLKLFFSGQALAEDEVENLLRAWYRINTIRLVATAGAWLAISRAKRQLLA